MPGPKKLMNDLKRKRKAALMLGRGATKAEVGRAVGVSRPTVSRWANQDEAKAWIEAEGQRYLESLPDALAMSKNILTAGKRESEKLLGGKSGTADGKILELATREGEQLRKSAGLTPTPNQALIIQNIYTDKRTILVGGVVGDLLRKHFGEIADQGQEETANHPLTGTDDGEEV
jgi:transcriptional regulator with XRE-family HTH domain